MKRSPKFYGYLYFLLATFFLIFAIQQNNRTEGWDVLTIILMAVAAIDYLIAFKHFGAAKRQKNNNRKSS
ncbi:YdiK family protein [Evansella clarkii]|jgi:UDP-N-acetylmuramyl pentapeptide phosphotransferase/UDP-N-acetylglucosamine-1-phosphate transferase|uniref:YdiK family protein n=1 Tax=Evansella clarkii TaxID=79879 RepID=UPI000998A770|nr:YdiK family protein [Evansella clarkii]